TGKWEVALVALSFAMASHTDAEFDSISASTTSGLASWAVFNSTAGLLMVCTRYLRSCNRFTRALPGINLSYNTSASGSVMSATLAQQWGNCKKENRIQGLTVTGHKLNF